MTRPSLILTCLLVPATAMAQNSAATTPGALDLSVPQAPLRYLGDAPTYRNDPPGTYYGDRSGPRPRKQATAATASEDTLQVHGAISTGIGYSKAFGNSHWSAADINLGKNYTTDEGKTRRVDVNIHVSQGKGVGPFGYGPGPWYGW